MLNIIDIFAGAGGLSEGFRNNNFNFILHAEMNKNACDTLKTREAYYYLKSVNKLDIYKAYLLGEIDKQVFYDKIPQSYLSKIFNIEISEDTINFLYKVIDEKLNGKKLNGIVGGPPCQAFSTIGRHMNESKKNTDKRVYLYQYYFKLLERYEPDFFVFENVKGLLSFKDGKDELLLPKIESLFKSIGYKIYRKVINSSEYGVPQNRERLFIVGFKKEINNKDFFDELTKFKENSVTIRELFNDLPFITAGQVLNQYNVNTPSFFVKKYIRKNDLPLTWNIARPHNQKDLKIYKIVANAKINNIFIKYYDLPKELQSHKNKNSFIDRFKSIKYDGYSHTIVSHISKDGHYYIHPDSKQNRSLSVREAARIQTFTDDFYFEGSRTDVFIQIGNAVPPLLAKKLALGISDFIYKNNF
ncbi:MAG: DNA cytosine methyltransferase [Spiroplasma sp.]|nr:DNA cytosine methyltransferase [Spiroplasma sp.]